MLTTVLIAGGGLAGLEAALALHGLAAGRVAVTVLAPAAELTYRRLSLSSGAPTYPLARIAIDAGFTHVRDRLASVDPEGHVVTTAGGDRLGYDALLIAAGGCPVEPFGAATAFAGSAADHARLRGIVQDIEEGYVQTVAFVVPPGATWAPALYELALMLAERARQAGAELDLHVITAEATPVAKRLGRAGITLHTGVVAELEAPGRLRAGATTLHVERIVSVPRLEGPAIPGLPAGPLVTDEHARVIGVPDVYAAGDVTAEPVKGAEVARRQAVAAAAAIAVRAGACARPAATGGLAAYLATLDEEATRGRGDEILTRG